MLQFLDSLDTYSATAPKPSAAGGQAGAPGTTLPRSTSNHGGLGSSVGPGSKPPASASSGGGPAAKAAPNAAEAQSVLDFLDEITQRSSTPTASVKAGDRPLEKKASIPTGLGRSTSRQNLTGAGGAGAAGQVPPRRSTDSVRSQRTVGGTPVGGAALPASPRSAAAAVPQTASTASASTASAASETAAKQQDSQGGGWGWSSMWSQASNVVQQASHLAQQARTAAEEQVKTATSGGAGGVAGGIAGIGGGLMKALGENEQAKKWSEGVINYAKGAHLDQLGELASLAVSPVFRCPQPVELTWEHLLGPCRQRPEVDDAQVAHRPPQRRRASDCRARGHPGQPQSRHGRLRRC